MPIIPAYNESENIQELVEPRPQVSRSGRRLVASAAGAGFDDSPAADPSCGDRIALRPGRPHKELGSPAAFAERGGNLCARQLTAVPVQDMTAGFVGYRAAALRKIDLDQMRSEEYAFLMELKFTLHRMGVGFHEFPIVFTERG